MNNFNFVTCLKRCLDRLNLTGQKKCFHTTNAGYNITYNEIFFLTTKRPHFLVKSNCNFYNMEVNQMISVILAGGKGQRLWPESRLAHPKQFCKFLDDKSLLETTIDCLMNAGSNKVIIITNDSLLEATQVLIASRADSQMIEILSEPEGKNTAPAVGLALAKCGMVEEDSVLGIFPADHYISDIVGFTHSIQTAAKTALQGFIVTIGITPSRPETGYGYIEKDSLQINDLSNVYKVRSFLEKPDSTTAQAYINSDRYLWNSGIYLSLIHISEPTRLGMISYAVFCLKKKKTHTQIRYIL